MDFSKIINNDAFLLGAGILGNNTGHYGQFGPALQGGLSQYQNTKQNQYQQAMADQTLKLKLEQFKQQQEKLKQEQEAYQKTMAFTGGDPLDVYKIKNPEVKPTSDIQNYQYSQQNPDFIQYQKRNKTPLVSVAIDKGDNKYMEGRGTDEATGFKELQTKAQSAYSQNAALDQFIASAKDGYAGGAANMMSGVSNFLTSFGFDSSQLANTQMMEQAVGKILSEKMAELGARGLTDKDMEILKASLPRVESDPNARIAIAQILKKNNDGTIQEYMGRVRYEDETFPGNKFYRPSWMKTWKPSQYEQPTIQQDVPSDEVINSLLEKYK